MSVQRIGERLNARGDSANAPWQSLLDGLFLCSRSRTRASAILSRGGTNGVMLYLDEAVQRSTRDFTKKSRASAKQGESDRKGAAYTQQQSEA